MKYIYILFIDFKDFCQVFYSWCWAILVTSWGPHTDQLVFVDETGFTQKTFYHHYGQSFMNQKCTMHTFGLSSHWINVIAAGSLRRFLAVQMFHGACTRDVYNDFIITQLVSVLKFIEFSIITSYLSSILIHNLRVLL